LEEHAQASRRRALTPPLRRCAPVGEETLVRAPFLAGGFS